ncbi:UDP-glycosyltransferase 83A1-like [Magnolia sinica]|uniref:UDP-glycosyltransferase 83A1-like n=1 Tax=Magnolia sinica TaxID=86752 RepID=UPI00265925A3|nr:UDP-glycosyltransferase 83A1-like [Magnolia sinica]
MRTGGCKTQFASSRKLLQIAWIVQSTPFTRLERGAMGKPHAVVIPYPAQGHVIPLMELSYCLVGHGFKITFVNTDFNHLRIMAASPKIVDGTDHIRLISIPDGMETGEDRTDLGKLCDSILSVMPGCLEELIRKINGSDIDTVTCIIADGSMGWAIDVAKKMGIRGVAFWPASVGLLAAILHIPKLMEAGIIDDNGFPTKQQQMIKLSPTMPEMNIAHFSWLCIGDHTTQRTIFLYLLNNDRAIKASDWILCNSFNVIESSAFDLAPHILPIGPLHVHTQLGQLDGNFWQEDSTCLNWLDQQPARSVIYVAFGSFTVLNRHQFHELALGLELSNRPFLWVVRPDLINGSSEAYPDGFEARVADRGRMVGWSPQRKVLAHPSIACFVTHCGWNSTLEGLSNGVPFLCWPYFCDQFLNKSYISDVWKVGLGLSSDIKGIISRVEIKGKVDQLVSDEGIRSRALELKDMARKSVGVGGSSSKNFNDFVEAMKLEIQGIH